LRRQFGAVGTRGISFVRLAIPRLRRTPSVPLGAAGSPSSDLPRSRRDAAFLRFASEDEKEGHAAPSPVFCRGGPPRPPAVVPTPPLRHHHHGRGRCPAPRRHPFLPGHHESFTARSGPTRQSRPFPSVGWAKAARRPRGGERRCPPLPWSRSIRRCWGVVIPKSWASKRRCRPYLPW